MLIKKRIESTKAPKAIGPYSQALAVGDRIYVSGQLGVDPVTMDFVSDDILEQGKQVLANIEAILEAADSDLQHVVKVEIFLTDMSYFPAVSTLFGEIFDDPNPPARQTIEVRALPRYARIMMSCEAIRKYAPIDPSFNLNSEGQKIAREQY